MNLELEIVSPSEIVAKESHVSELIIPAHWGQMDVLPQHTDFMTTLTAGEVVFKKKDYEPRVLNIAGGLLRITNNKATLLVDGLLATVTSLDEMRSKKNAGVSKSS